MTLSADQAGALATAAAFRASRHRLQAEQRRRLAEELPLHQLVAPFVFSDSIGPAEIETIARALAAAVVAYQPDRANETEETGETTETGGAGS